MRLLLDTATFIWLVEGDSALNQHARESIVDPENEVFLSAASAWEIVINHSLGRLVLHVPPDEYVTDQRRLHRIETLSMSELATSQADTLPSIHRDPFDRIIVAQAIVHGLTIVTSDRLIRMYPVPAVW